MPDYLLEVGTEELPADFVSEAQGRLKSLMSDALCDSNLTFDSMETLGTPRRITCLVRGLSPMQPTMTRKVKGPKLDAAFDKDGKPSAAATGFAQKHRTSVDELDREEIGGVVYLVANLTVEGRPAAEVLQEIVPRAISQMSGERLMRWGSSDLRFSRPIRWIVSLLDKDVVFVELSGIRSGRESSGNRILHPGKVSIEGPDSYVETLRKARVMVDPAERRQTIEKQVLSAAVSVNGRPRQLSGALIDEVVNITEWPHAVLGEFARQYLDLPDTLIETVMVHHQRYFPVESAGNGNGKGLLPYFVAVANSDRQEAQANIKQGNERVLRARLADGRFFYFDDQKTRLTERVDALSQLTFQEGLGSYLDKRDRLVQLARILADSLGLDTSLAACLQRTAELCKLDLVSNLVRELPELQGYVGSWYAAREGESPDVVAAIASHYAPRHTDDNMPDDEAGRLTALLDRLDNLTGLFALGRRPTGSSDPYALRRQAQGLTDILCDGLSQYRISINALIDVVLSLLEPFLSRRKNYDATRTRSDLQDFLRQRIRTKLQEAGAKREIIDAVMSARDPLDDYLDCLQRLNVVGQLTDNEPGLNVVRAGVRVGNILKPDSPESLNPADLTTAAEKELWQAFQDQVVSEWEKDGSFRPPMSEDEYSKIVNLLGSLVPGIDRLFDEVMVNDPDRRKRDTRHGMLNAIHRYFYSVADFTKLQPLLP